MSCLENEPKETDLVTVSELFEHRNCYRIPDYQRGYAWQDEFKVLCDDIIRVFRGGKDAKLHYTGMLALEEIKDDSLKEKESVKGRNAFYVVDGQQRLTSIVILIKAIQEYIVRQGEQCDNILEFPDGTFRFDYSKDYSDTAKSFFEKRIYSGQTNNIVCTDLYCKNISEAKNYIDSILISYSVDEAKEILSVIENKLLFNIYFANKDNFDVRVTFETMNNRGKKLSNLELLKNRLMYLTAFIKNTETSSNYQSILINSINKAWCNIYANLCYKNYQLNDNEYLRAHWCVYGSLNKSKGDIYIRDLLNEYFSIDKGTFSNLISRKDFDGAFKMIKRYVDSLGLYSGYWGIINNPTERLNPTNEDEKERMTYLAKLNRETSQIYVRAAEMVIEGNSNLSNDRKNIAYKSLERSLFVNVLVGGLRNDYSSLIKPAKELLISDSESKAIDAFNMIIDTLNSGELSVTNDKIRYSFKQLGNELDPRNKPDFFYDWKDLQYFLYEYNDGLDIKGTAIDWSGLSADSIEHILPQHPSCDYWKIVLSPIGSDEEKVRRITNSLGNLLLLSKAGNSSVRNYSYTTKAFGVDHDDSFAYVYGSRSAQKVAKDYKYWSLHSIFIRQKELVNFMYSNWVVGRGVSLSEDDFYSILKENGLLIDDFAEIDEQTEEKLNSLDLSNERKTARMAQPIQTDGWFISLLPYFDKHGFDTQKNPRKLYYLKNRFTFKKVKDGIQCGIGLEKENRLWFGYYESENAIYVSERIDGDWHQLTNQETMPEQAKFFITSIGRWLRDVQHRPNLILKMDNPELSRTDDQMNRTLDDFLAENKMLETIKDLFLFIRSRVYSNLVGFKEVFGKDFVNFKYKYIFFEIFPEKEKVKLYFREGKPDSKELTQVPESFGWSFKFRADINQKEQFNELIDSLILSADSAK